MLLRKKFFDLQSSLVSYVLFMFPLVIPIFLEARKEKIFLVEGILKVRKKSGNRERCRKLSL